MWTHTHDALVVMPAKPTTCGVDNNGAQKFALWSEYCPPPGAGLPLSFLNWAYVHQGVYFWAYGTPGVSTFGVFRTPSLPIFGVIFGLLEATKIYKLF